MFATTIKSAANENKFALNFNWIDLYFSHNTVFRNLKFNLYNINLNLW
jgi:hypothetical protein